MYKIILILLLIIIYLLFITRYDYFDNLDPQETPTKLNPTTFVLDDIYEKTQQFDNSSDGRLGIDKCYENCKGNCVEFGITGFAFCFTG